MYDFYNDIVRLYTDKQFVATYRVSSAITHTCPPENQTRLLYDCSIYLV